jgi:hypothetical protein
MWMEIGITALTIIGVNIIFWIAVLQYKKRSERLSPIVIDDEGEQALVCRKASYLGTFDVEDYRIFSNWLFAKGTGTLKLTQKYLIFRKRLSRRDIIIPLRYMKSQAVEIRPGKKPIINVHWKNGNVELVSHLSLNDGQKPEDWIARIKELTA